MKEALRLLGMRFSMPNVTPSEFPNDKGVRA